ncbi:MAG TPA: D-glucuronyl C5-epimerase family protein [Alphaproteobacteria bacterium]|jgi:hypothetical protein
MSHCRFNALWLEMKRNVWRAKKFVLYLRGISYHNVRQGIGRAYVPGRLDGYFNDLTAKTTWAGAVNAEGLPLMVTDTGRVFLFPIMLFQLALGHWDLWLLSSRRDKLQLDRFLQIADWAAANLDAQDGWSCWDMIDRGAIDSPYSAMAQGQGLSVLARAYAEGGDARYAAAAARALAPLVREPSPLKINRRCEGHLIFEEYPGAMFPAVLNGWIFALFGLQDYGLAFGGAAKGALSESLDGLVAFLPRFDIGYWSLYDLGGNLAGPFYHQLHIVQLRALALTFPGHAKEIADGIAVFERQQASGTCRMRAIAVKIFQKLRSRGISEVMPTKVDGPLASGPSS